MNSRLKISPISFLFFFFWLQCPSVLQRKRLFLLPEYNGQFSNKHSLSTTWVNWQKIWLNKHVVYGFAELNYINVRLLGLEHRYFSLLFRI